MEMHVLAEGYGLVDVYLGKSRERRQPQATDSPSSSVSGIDAEHSHDSGSNDRAPVKMEHAKRLLLSHMILFNYPLPKTELS